MNVRVLPDGRAAAQAASAHLAGCVRRVAASGGRCALALAGGSTPRAAYQLLAAEALPWDRVHVFWTDERAVPPGHPDSNFRMVRDALLTRAPIPDAGVHRVAGELPPRAAAAEYQRELERFFDAAPPRFDLVLLGLGADAHTASLFPFDPLLFERTASVGVSRPRLERGPRVSLTLPAINAAAEVVFLVTGSSKASAVRQVLGAAWDPIRLPAQGVGRERATWLLDRDAASQIQF